MLLTIDAGNTNVAFAVFEDGEKRGAWRCSTDRRRTADEYAVWLLALMRLQHIGAADITGTILASVVPEATFNLERLCREHFHNEPLVIGDPKVRLGLEIETIRPEEAGADRVVNAVGALVHHAPPCIIVDFGTATTFDVITPKGAYGGGVIAPGINLSLDALHAAAAKLPRIDVRRPDKVVGTTTTGAMQSGIFWGYAGLIEGIIARIQDEGGFEATILATGGLGRLFRDHVPIISHYDPDLTLRGLLKIYELNTQ